MPFVDHHGVHAGQALGGIGLGQQQRQRFGRADQHRGQAAVLPRTFGAGRVAAAQAQGPGGRQVGQRRGQGALAVGGQCAHRRDPQHAERRCGLAGGRHTQRRSAGQRAQGNGVGLAGAGGGMQQATAAGGHGRPHLALEVEGLPAAAAEPRRDVQGPG
jgi:hypothetical protein